MANRQNFSRNQGYNQRTQGGPRDQGYHPRNQDNDNRNQNYNARYQGNNFENRGYNDRNQTPRVSFPNSIALCIQLLPG